MKQTHLYFRKYAPVHSHHHKCTMSQCTTYFNIVSPGIIERSVRAMRWLPYCKGQLQKTSESTDPNFSVYLKISEAYRYYIEKKKIEPVLGEEIPGIPLGLKTVQHIYSHCTVGHQKLDR